MSYIAILGRQPALGTAELERTYGGTAVTPISLQSVIIDCEDFEIQRFGGVLKAGKIITELQPSNWRQVSQRIVQLYSDKSIVPFPLTLSTKNWKRRNLFPSLLREDSLIL